MFNHRAICSKLAYAIGKKTESLKKDYSNHSLTYREYTVKLDDGIEFSLMFDKIYFENVIFVNCDFSPICEEIIFKDFVFDQLEIPFAYVLDPEFQERIYFQLIQQVEKHENHIFKYYTKLWEPEPTPTPEPTPEPEPTPVVEPETDADFLTYYKLIKCETCDCYLTKSNFSRHTKTQKHIRNLK
jgi:hypothetical protein